MAICGYALNVKCRALGLHCSVLGGRWGCTAACSAAIRGCAPSVKFRALGLHCSVLGSLRHSRTDTQPLSQPGNKNDDSLGDRNVKNTDFCLNLIKMSFLS